MGRISHMYVCDSVYACALVLKGDIITYLLDVHPHLISIVLSFSLFPFYFSFYSFVYGCFILVLCA